MTQYQSVSWGDEEITAAKLNQMNANTDYLLERAVPHQYSAYSTNKTTGLKVICGIVSIGPSTARQMSKNVYFGRYFSAGCRPVVLATHASSNLWRVFISIGGIGANNLRPDHNGFKVVLNSDPLSTTKNHFAQGQHIHWLALGY